jgi:membrane protein implicated in regulation of membrane protease activity
MNIDQTNILNIATFVCVVILTVGLWLPTLVVAIAALILAILGFIFIGWAWQLLLLLLISVINFMFWWAGRRRSY